eukprot:scaffold18907_cov33-Tisochrysis_lutea.AAC.2
MNNVGCGGGCSGETKAGGEVEGGKGEREKRERRVRNNLSRSSRRALARGEHEKNSKLNFQRSISLEYSMRSSVGRWGATSLNDS